MRRNTPKRRARRFGLWLGLVALAIQGIFPFLLAAELRAASFAEDMAVFCQVDNGTGSDQAGGGMQPMQGHDHVHCPICLGLQAGGPFLQADAPALLLPAFAGPAHAILAATALAPASYALAYRSRAPPFQGSSTI